MLTTERVVELLGELSLVDLGRLLLAKAAGPEGLSKDNAGSLEMSTDHCKLIVRRLKTPKKRKT